MRLVENPRLPADCCPPSTTLQQFLDGKLPESRIQFIEQHLESCQHCGDTIRALDTQSTHDDLAKLIADDSSFDDLASNENREQVGKLIDKLQAMDLKSQSRGNSQPVDSETRAKEVTLMLGPSDDPNHLGRIAHYEVTHLLGSGGTGVVFKAIDTQLQRPVAIKILRPSLGNAARQRFLSEARTAALIDHEQVITIYNVGESEELAYIAMQWLPGETLENRLERDRTLDNDFANDIFRQVAIGLAAAHDKGLIHRDIKPANIWIEQDGGRVKILDFGLARVADDDPQFTETGMIAGTPTFMSPEQARGGQVDSRSDLFSLGCVLYRMTAGQLPFQAANILATLQSIQRFNPPAPIELNPATDRRLNDLALCLLEKNADRRPQSAVAVLHALETESDKWDFRVPQPVPLQQNEIEPKPKPLATKTGGAMRRWIIAALLLVMLGSGCWLYGPQIIRIATGKALVTIETNDNDVQIEVVQDGRVVKLLDSQTNQSIEIKEGSYRLQAVGEGNSVAISPNQLVLSRGDKEIVKVTVQANDSVATSASTRTSVDDFQKQFAIDSFLNVAETASSRDDMQKTYDQTKAMVEAGHMPQFLLHTAEAAVLDQKLELARATGNVDQVNYLKPKLAQALKQSITGYYEAADNPKWKPHLPPAAFAQITSALHSRYIELIQPNAADRPFRPSHGVPQGYEPPASHSHSQSELSPEVQKKLTELLRCRADLIAQIQRRQPDTTRQTENRDALKKVQEIDEEMRQLAPNGELERFLALNPYDFLASANEPQPSQWTKEPNAHAVKSDPKFDPAERVRELLQKRAQLEKDLQGYRENFAADHPTVRFAESDLRAIDNELKKLSPHGSEKNELTYDGVPLSNWLNLAKTERSKEKCTQILTALSALSEPANSQAILEAAFTIYRHSNFLSLHKNAEMATMLKRLDPEKVVDALISELKTGNKRSRYASAKMIGDTCLNVALAKVVTQPKVIEKILIALEEAIVRDEESSIWREEFCLNLYMAGTRASSPKRSFYFAPLEPSVLSSTTRKKIATLLGEYSDRLTSDSKSKLIDRILVYEKVFVEEKLTALADQFWNSNHQSAFLAHHEHLNSLAKLKCDMSPAINSLVDRVRARSAKLSVRGLMTDEKILFSVRLFESLGSHASAAVPLLLEIEKGYSTKDRVELRHKRFVRKIIAAIDEEAMNDLPEIPKEKSNLSMGGGGGDAAADSDPPADPDKSEKPN